MIPKFVRAKGLNVSYIVFEYSGDVYDINLYSGDVFKRNIHSETHTLFSCIELDRWIEEAIPNV